MAKSEQVSAHNIKNADWDSPFLMQPSCEVGEFSQIGCDPVVADLNAKSFTESRRTGDGAAS